MSRTRKQSYTKSKDFSRRCRNNGSCGYCKDNRTFFDRKHRPSIPNKEDEENQYIEYLMENSFYEE